MCLAGLNTATNRIESTRVLNFEEIVERFSWPLYRFALGLARDEVAACDLTQQTFSLWVTKGHLVRDQANIRSWLFATLYHQFTTNRRREKQWLKEEITETEDELPCANSKMIDRLEPRQVMECLQSMHETFRAPLLLFYLDEHSYQEIADILAIPVETVMSRICRGKQELPKAFISMQANGIRPAASRRLGGVESTKAGFNAQIIERA